MTAAARQRRSRERRARHELVVQDLVVGPVVVDVLLATRWLRLHEIDDANAVGRALIAMVTEMGEALAVARDT